MIDLGWKWFHKIVDFFFLTFNGGFKTSKVFILITE